MNENLSFIFESSELFGQIQLLYTLLLSKGPYKQKIEKENSFLPQSVIVASVLSIKILNSITRINLSVVQNLIINNNLIQDSLSCVIAYLISYCIDHIEDSDETKELLHETILFIGYICLLENKIQNLMLKGESTILQKIISLPFNYYFDNKLKEIFLPTLITLSFENKIVMEIVNKEMDFGIVLVYINEKINLEPILEEEFDESYIEDKLENLSYLNDNENSNRKSINLNLNSSNVNLKSTTNLSGSKIKSNLDLISNTSSVKSCHDMITGTSEFISFALRFPRKLWEKAKDFYSLFKN